MYGYRSDFGIFFGRTPSYIHPNGKHATPWKEPIWGDGRTAPLSIGGIDAPASGIDSELFIVISM